jgi:hypothetical protein
MSRATQRRKKKHTTKALRPYMTPDTGRESDVVASDMTVV